MVWNRLFNYVCRIWTILFNGLSRLKIKNPCVIDYNDSSRIFCIWLSIIFMDLPIREGDKRVEGRIRHKSVQDPTFNSTVIVLLPIPDLLIQCKLSRFFHNVVFTAMVLVETVVTVYAGFDILNLNNLAGF